MHSLNWQPGKFGKGLLTKDGVLHTWEGVDPFHNDYAEQNGIQNYDSFLIRPNGSIYTVNLDSRLVSRIDPRLKGRDNYHIANLEEDNEFWDLVGFPIQPNEGRPGVDNLDEYQRWVREIVDLGYQPGFEGKGVRFDDQKVEWVTSPMGNPHHHEVLDALDIQSNLVESLYQIAEDGYITAEWEDNKVGDYHWRFGSDKLSFSRRTTSNLHFLVATKNDNWVGSLGYLAKDNTAYIQHIYVKPELRREGIASSLYDELAREYSHIDDGDSTQDGFNFLDSLEDRPKL